MKQAGQKGFALIITLVITALLVAVVTEFIREVYVDTTLRRTWLNAQQASLLADSGITAGISLLQESQLRRKMEPARGYYTSLTDSWARPLSLPAEEGTVDVVIEEENGKLDLNSLATNRGLNEFFTPVAQKLFTQLELPEALLNALGDWADEDEQTATSGAEMGYYLGLNPAYECRNKRLQTVEELGLVKGYIPEVLGKLLPYVTAYGPSTLGGNKININTAPETLLLSLHRDMTMDMAKSLVKHRESEPFETIGDVTKAGIPTTYVPATVADVKGYIYRIRAKATVGEAVRTIEAVVDTTNVQSPKKLYWREY